MKQFLPQEIVEHILLRLSPESLIRFKCVCKSWYALFNDPSFVNMLLEDKNEDLKRMYNLFRLVPDGLSTIQEVMTSYIRETGEKLVTDPEMLKDQVKIAQRLSDEKDKHDRIISSSFENDKTFQNALNSSFEYLNNLNTSDHNNIIA